MLTNKQTPLKTSTSLRYATPVTTAEDVLPHTSRRNHPPPRSDGMSRPLLHDIICNERVLFRPCRGWSECTARFLILVTLTFKLVRARDHTHLHCEFGANPFSRSGVISVTNKKVECDGPMHNVMAALPNIGGVLCSTPQSLADAHY